MLAVPLMFTEELPKAQLTYVPDGASPAASPASAGGSRWQKSSSRSRPTCFRTPAHCARRRKIPRKYQMIKEEEAPPPMAARGGVVGGVPGGIPGGQLGGVIGGIVNAHLELAIVPKFVPVLPSAFAFRRA